MKTGKGYTMAELIAICNRPVTVDPDIKVYSIYLPQFYHGMTDDVFHCKSDEEAIRLAKMQVLDANVQWVLYEISVKRGRRHMRRVHVHNPDSQE